MLMENTDFYARTWTHLVDTETGRTLHLGPRERADVDVPDDFRDPFLKPVAPKAKKTKPDLEPAGDNSDEVKE